MKRGMLFAIMSPDNMGMKIAGAHRLWQPDNYFQNSLLSAPCLPVLVIWSWSTLLYNNSYGQSDMFGA